MSPTTAGGVYCLLMDVGGMTAVGVYRLLTNVGGMMAGGVYCLLTDFGGMKDNSGPYTCISFHLSGELEAMFSSVSKPGCARQHCCELSHPPLTGHYLIN